MKARTRKLLSLLVTLCMVIGLLPGMALTAAAANAPAATVRVNGNVTLNGDKPYLLNGKAAETGVLGSDGCTAFYDVSSGTLTLKGYNGGRISAWGSSSAKISLTVVVDGANTITATGGSGINCMYGDLIVKGATADKNTDALTVTSVNSCVEAYQGNLTIQDLKEVNVASTATNNEAISVMFGDALTISNVGTMKVSMPNIGGGYTAVSNRSGSVSITGVTDLEVYSGGKGIRAAGSSASPAALSITGCGKVMLYGGSASSAIEGYQSSVTVSAGTVVAIGGRQAVNASGGDISIAAANTLYLNGGSSAVYGNQDVTVTKGGSDVEDLSGKTVAPDGNGSTGKTSVTLSISDTNLTYTGQPASLTVTATTTGESPTPVTEPMTYLYVWYDSNDTVLGGTAPVDAGSYSVTVRGYNDTYMGELVKQPVTIGRANALAEYVNTVSADIGIGNNVITLPEIPSRMSFGTVFECDSSGNAVADADKKLTLTLSGNQLAVSAYTLSDDTYYISAPVSGTNCNYENYDIILTLTKLTAKAIFDRCDGSTPSEITIGSPLPDTALYDASTNPDGAWQAAIGNAKMYGYEFAGWYTAPNGWGQQVSDKYGKDPANPTQNATFSAGTTYYAKWVWTRGYVDYAEDSGALYYAELTPNRTVYTTCLDFTNANMVNDLIVGDGYSFNGTTKTLTLAGVHIQALDSVCGIILPADSTIQLCSLQEGWSYGEGFDENGNPNGEDYSSDRHVSNIISCGSVDATADVFCKGNLTIAEDRTPFNDEEEGLGNWLNVKRGGIWTQGTLTIDKADVSAARLRADGDIAIKNDALIFATNYSSTFTGDRYVRSYNGSVTIDRSWVFTEWLQAATDLSISGRESRVWASFGASAGETITISDSGYKDLRNDTYNFALNFGDEDNALWGLYAKDINISNSVLNSSSIMTGEKLTVSGGSEVNAHGSQMALPICIYGGGSISNSTVNVTEVGSGSVGIYGTGPLTINSSTVTVTKANDATPTAAILVIAPENGTGLVLSSAAITAPSGASVEKLPSPDDENTALWYIVKSDDTIAKEVTISPVVYVDDTPVSYPVTAPKETEGGSVAASPKNAARGKTVTLTVTADEGYELDSITVTDKNGKELTLTDAGDGKFTFTMPAGKVEISAAFKAVEPEPVGPAYEDFSDLEEGAWYHDGIAYVLEKGLMNGVGDSEFDPAGQTSRAMVAAILWRLADCPEAGAESAFTDVPAGTWYTDAAAWAAETGIANGYNGEFDPEGAITREQLACMLYRFAQSQGKGFTGEWMFPLNYTDADSVSGWAYEAMCWMTMNGVINGKGGNVLDPQGMATRAEAAAMLLRFAESMK